jgi:hypothetical protein
MKPTAAPNEETLQVYIRRDPQTRVAVQESWTEDNGGFGGRFHREGGPAAVVRDPVSGNVIQEYWYFHGKLHREDGPAVVRRTPDGKIKYSSWFHNGELVPHRRRGKTSAPETAPASPS